MQKYLFVGLIEPRYSLSHFLAEETELQEREIECTAEVFLLTVNPSGIIHNFRVAPYAATMRFLDYMRT